MTDTDPTARAGDDLACSNCGAAFEFAPGSGRLECPFCGTENEIPPAVDQGPWGRTDVLRERDLASALSSAMPPGTRSIDEEVETVRCPGCGAEIGLDAGTLADECPFCATALSRRDLHSHRHPRPQGVLPFALDERAARAALTRWLGRLWFAPSGLKRYATKGRPLAGVYIPHYTYDAHAAAQYRGFRGDAYYVTQTVPVRTKQGTTMKTRRVRKIRWTPVSGRIRRTFDDVLVLASDTLGDLVPEAEASAPWDLQDLKPYTTEFLAGFRAEAPRIGLETGYARAASVMEQVLAQDARRQIGGDAQRLTGLDASYSAVTFKHVLLPVWLAAFRYGNKPYRVVVNARTGTVRGERPYSAIKIAVGVVAALVVLGAVAYVVSQGQAG